MNNQQQQHQPLHQQQTYHQQSPQQPHQPLQPQQHQPQHRVLLYTTCYNVLDGVTLTIRKLEQEILAAGHAVCILTTRSGDINNTHAYFDQRTNHQQHGNAAVAAKKNRQVIFLDSAFCIPFLHDPNKPQLTYQIGFGLSLAIQQQLHDFSPTIMHITTTDITSMHLIHYARTREIPLMGTFHSNIPDYMEHYPGLSWLRPILAHFFRHQYNFLQLLCVPTPYIERNLMSCYQMHHVTSLRQWGRGVDVQQFHPTARRCMSFRRSLGIADSDVVVLWVGRLVPEKRTDIFCETIQRLAAIGNVPFKALVVGDGPCEDDIKRLPHTIFCGWQNVEQLAVTYASSDIFLFPSSVETFGNVTLEAMASGLPVVVESKCSGHSVRDGENGYACRAGDTTAFFRKTLQLIQHDDLRRRFSATSRRMSLALEKRKIVRQMLHHYTTVTREFYVDYNGHHANRDAVYSRKLNSFVAGKQPRPLLFILVERLFIFFFGVIWHMMDSFMLMQEKLLGFSVSSSPSHARVPIPSTMVKEKQLDFAAHDVCKTGEEETPSIFELSSVDLAGPDPYQQEQDPMLSSSCTTASSLLDCSTDSSMDDGQDCDCDDSDDTRSTASSNGISEAESSFSSSATTISSNGRRRGYERLFGDFSLTHALAMAFIHCVFFVSRWESHLRDACVGVWSYTTRCRRLQPDQQQRHKRKNSGVHKIVVEADIDRVMTKLVMRQQARCSSTDKGASTLVSSQGTKNEASLSARAAVLAENPPLRRFQSTSTLNV
jgi:phosphatidylinositol alpha 1,6-mannosyltransferase